MDFNPELSPKYDSKINFLDNSNFNPICDQKTLTERGTIALKYSLDDKFIYTCDGLNNWFIKSRACTQLTEIHEPLNNLTSTEINVISNILYVNDRTLLNLLYKYQITNISGKSFKSGDVEINKGQGIININGINSGIYFLSLENVSYKFIITR